MLPPDGGVHFSHDHMISATVTIITQVKKTAIHTMNTQVFVCVGRVGGEGLGGRGGEGE